LTRGSTASITHRTPPNTPNGDQMEIPSHHISINSHMNKKNKVFMAAEDIIAIGIGLMGVILFGIILYDYV